MATRFLLSFRVRAALLLGAALLAGRLPAGAQVFEVDNRLVTGRAEIQAGMGSGTTLAAGDLDLDGRPDLVLGEPFRDDPIDGVPALNTGGTTFVAVAARAPVFLGGAPGTDFRAVAGSAIALGDFNGDGDLELAVGEPNAEVRGRGRAGRVLLWDGLPEADSVRQFNQDTQGLGGDAEVGDDFGAALAVGDFDGDGFDDLVVGVPGEAVGDVHAAGAVHVLYGGAQGLVSEGSDFWVPGVEGFPLPATPTAEFGAALAAGDFDGDGIDDLAIGAPGVDLAVPVPTFDVGRVVVLRGGVEGLVLEGARTFFEEQLAFGITEPGDQFGRALAAGDFDRTAGCVSGGECADELVVGVPGEDLGGETPFAGKVMVVPGVAGEGLDLDQTRSFNAFHFGREVERGADFGRALAVGQLDSDRADDLAIGEPLRDFETSDEGSVYLLFGGAGGLVSERAQRLEARAGLASAPAGAGDNFGAALAIADFDGDGHGDLAIGIPGRDVEVDGETLTAAGAVQILWGALFADGFERGSTAGWDVR